MSLKERGKRTASANVFVSVRDLWNLILVLYFLSAAPSFITGSDGKAV